MVWGTMEPEAQDPAASQCQDQTDLSVTPGFYIYWLADWGKLLQVSGLHFLFRAGIITTC